MAKFVVLVVILSIMTGCSSGLGEKSIVDDSEEVDVVEDAGVNTTLATELNLDNESDKSFDQINDELSLLNDNLHNLIESIDDANKLAENVVDNNRMALKEELENLLLEQKMLEDKMDDFYYDIDVINELDKYKSWDANIYNENLTESMTKLNELRDSRNTLKDDIDNFTIKEVHVNSVEELISEISSNKHIILEEGVYTIDEDLFTKDIFLGIPVDSTFMIEEIGNLTIEGEAGKEITISTEVDMGYFITIRDCYNVKSLILILSLNQILKHIILFYLYTILNT